LGANVNKVLVVNLSAVLLDGMGIGLIFLVLPKLLREVPHDSQIED
jgi:hypothetical protein